MGEFYYCCDNCKYMQGADADGFGRCLLIGCITHFQGSCEQHAKDKDND